MSQLTINTGTTANDGTGDSLRAGGIKLNANFDEIYARQDKTSGKTLYVDSVNGHDSGGNIGVRGTTKPFATIHAAAGVFIAGDRMVIGAGLTTSAVYDLFDAWPGSGSIEGGDIINTNGGCLYFAAQDGNSTVRVNILSAHSRHPIWTSGGGTHYLWADLINSDLGDAIGWGDSQHIVVAGSVTGKQAVLAGDSFFGVDGQAASGGPSTTYNLDLTAGKITTTSTTLAAIEWPAGINSHLDGDGNPLGGADQVIWVQCNHLKSSGGVLKIGSPNDLGTKLYFDSQKAEGLGAVPAIDLGAGQTWTDISKLTCSHIFLRLTGGKSWHDIRHMEVGTTAAQFIIDVTGGEHVIRNVHFIGGASNKGIRVIGAADGAPVKVTFIGCYFDLSANSSTDALLCDDTNGVTTTVELINTVFKSHASRKDIVASNAGIVNSTGGSGSGAAGAFTLTGSINRKVG